MLTSSRFLSEHEECLRPCPKGSLIVDVVTTRNTHSPGLNYSLGNTIHIWYITISTRTCNQSGVEPFLHSSIRGERMKRYNLSYLVLITEYRSLSQPLAKYIFTPKCTVTSNRQHEHQVGTSELLYQVYNTRQYMMASSGSTPDPNRILVAGNRRNSTTSPPPANTVVLAGGAPEDSLMAPWQIHLCCAI